MENQDAKREASYAISVDDGEDQLGRPEAMALRRREPCDAASPAQSSVWTERAAGLSGPR
jgi:hypothetical protein